MIHFTEIPQHYGAEFRETWEHWLEYREYKKDISKQYALSRLLRIATNEDHAVQILRTAIACEWKDFYNVDYTEGNKSRAL